LKPWPGIIVQLYLGAVNAESVLSAAKNPDPNKEKQQLCEAYFYLGELSLIAGNRAAAILFFQNTLKTGITNYIEYTGAKQELIRLDALPKS
jgi:lipoprotein NlpI